MMKDFWTLLIILGLVITLCVTVIYAIFNFGLIDPSSGANLGT